MQITRKKINENGLNIAIRGALDAQTTPDFEFELRNDIENIKDVIFDFEEVEYLSSVALRVLLSFHKELSTNGSMKIINVKPAAMYIFKMTGFDAILDISCFD